MLLKEEEEEEEEEEESSVFSQLEEKKPGRHLLDNTSLDKYWTKNISAVLEEKNSVKNNWQERVQENTKILFLH